jgi:hypothetical protein
LGRSHWHPNEPIAQAAREKQARIILAQAEVEIASMFDTASEAYQDNPTALHLRAMNMLYEGSERERCANARAEHGS